MAANRRGWLGAYETDAGACRSDGMEQIALGDLEKDAELSELDTAMFSRAPVEAMQATLAYIRCSPLRGPHMDMTLQCMYVCSVGTVQPKGLARRQSYCVGSQHLWDLADADSAQPLTYFQEIVCVPSLRALLHMTRLPTHGGLPVLAGMCEMPGSCQQRIRIM